MQLPRSSHDFDFALFADRAGREHRGEVGMHGGFEFGEAVAEERGRSPREGEGVAGEFVDGPGAIPWMTPRLDVVKKAERPRTRSWWSIGWS